MIAISVLGAIGMVIGLGLLFAWRLDRTAKRQGARIPDPATMTRSADDRRRNPDAVDHWVTFQSHTGV